MSFEKFTDKARKVLVLAQDEARALHQPYVGTEHILLGLIKEKDGLAAQAPRISDTASLPRNTLALLSTECQTVIAT